MIKIVPSGAILALKSRCFFHLMLKMGLNHEIINLEMTPKKGGCAETSNHICGHMFTNLKYFNIVSLGNVRYVIGNS